MIAYRILHELPDLEAVVDLEIATWGMNPRDAVPSAVLHILALNGGLVLGAYAGDQLAGILVSMPVQRSGERILWSHMTGVHPQYQRQGIGLGLKRQQRRWALERGYRSIRWTYDPLQRGNAWFNLHLLGEDAALTCNQYHVNFYGDMDDDINRGMPSDRIEVCWQIDQPSAQQPDLQHAPLLLCPNADGLPVSQPVRWNSATYAVPVPNDLSALRQCNPDVVLAWRLALREALMVAFEQGYTAFDFVMQDAQYQYLLCKKEMLT